MTPQEQYECWFRRAVGITVEEARRREVYDLKILRSAFMAGMIKGEQQAAERHADRERKHGT